MYEEMIGKTDIFVAHSAHPSAFLAHSWPLFLYFCIFCTVNKCSKSKLPMVLDLKPVPRLSEVTTLQQTMTNPNSNPFHV